MYNENPMNYPAQELATEQIESAEITTQVGRQERVVMRLADTVVDLCGRLGPILGPGAEEKSYGREVTKNIESALGQALCITSDKIDDQTNKLNDIINRLRL